MTKESVEKARRSPPTAEDGTVVHDSSCGLAKVLANIPSMRICESLPPPPWASWTLG